MSKNEFGERIAKLPRDRLELLAAELMARLDRAERSAAKRNEPIAVIGVGCRFPGGADDPDRYWKLLENGVDAVSEVPAERWSLERLYDADPDAPGKVGTRRGGFLKSVDGFDARFFGIAPREAVSLDPQHRLLLEVAWEALEDAGVAPDRLEGAAGGVFIGLCGHEYFELMLERSLESIDSYFASGAAGSMAAGRIAYLLGLHGPALTLDTACSSSLVALHLACESLRNGECRIALSGGASLMLGVETMIALTKAHMISPDGRCSTFDESANGIVRGEGCGMIVLKRLADAVADGDRVHAVIRATAINQDGRSSGITAPNGTAQEALMRAALKRAGLDGADVDYVEAHGTGTKLGDPIEVRALGAVYGVPTAAAPLKIGSVKTNFGHLEGAAGIAGVIKVLLALRHRTIPPHLHLHKRNPLIEWDRWAIDIPTELTPWQPRAADGKRRAAVSSFGFSGTNAHAIFEEAPAAPAGAADDGKLRLLPLAARTETALRALASAYANALPTLAGASFADVCHTAATGRARFMHRLCVLAASREEAAGALAAWSANGAAPQVITGRAVGRPEPVFLFTGQGAQYVDMGRGLFDSSAVFRAAIEQCDEALRGSLDVPLVDVLYPNEVNRERALGLIDRTAYTQPALFAVEYALAQLWRSFGVEPAAVAGHSIGEYVAAAVAGVMSVADALRLVAARGRLMDALPSVGGMAAVFADAATVDPVVQTIAGLEVAAYNSTANTVVSGPEAALAAALAAFAAQGVEAKRLVVSHAFHSAAMEPMLAELERTAGAVRLSPPEVPFFSTLTGAALEASTLTQPRYWRDQTRGAVRFEAALRALRAAGHDLYLEIGPHPTLCGLGRATLDADAAVFLPSLRRGESDRRELLRAVGALQVRGVEPRWESLAEGVPARKTSLPTYPFERVSYWIGWSARAHGRGAPTVGEPADAGPRPVWADALWSRAWVPAVPAGALAFPPPAAIAERLGSRGEALVAEHGGGIYDAFLPALDRLCTAYVCATLRALGMKLAVGEQVSERALLADGRVLRNHARLLHRMLEMLREDGIVAAGTAGEYTVADASAAAAEPEPMLERLLAQFPACRAELEVTERCGARLADVLTGAVPPMEVLFPGGSMDSMERLYADNPSFRVFNSLVAEAVEQAAGAAGRNLAMLEIGAGTGGTASRLLPLLRGRAERYVFTDISPVFLQRARQRFREFDFVEYELLDVSRDTAPQGFADGSFDIVVASNVLHATPILRETMERVRRLLRPGGLLVMLEGLRPQRFGDLTVGLTDGWWSFADTNLRPDYALLDARRWLELLEEVGFDAAEVVPSPSHATSGVLAQQGVIVARAPSRAPEALPVQQSGRWVALARRGAASGRLVEALQVEGVALELVEPAETAALGEALLATLRPADVVGALHLLSLDEQAEAEATGADALAAQARSTGSALTLAQQVARAGGRDAVFVTQATQAAGAKVADPSGSPLWGFARTVATEHPELRARRIDLPAGGDGARALAGWLREDPLPDEDEIALRPDGAYVARIVPHAGSETRPLRFAEAGSYLVTGGLAGLGLRVAEWLAERGAGRIVLAGRSEPSAAALQTIARLRSAGTDVRIVQGDVADAERVQAMIAAAGADDLRGVFHSAGVTHDATVLHQDWPRFEKVMRAKIAGAWNLHRATERLSLEHFVLFSTGAAFLGAAGQSNHAAANAFLEGLASYRRSRGLAALAIDWGAWSEIGAATRGDVIERAQGVGVGLISPDVGLAILEQLMAEGATHAAALVVDWQAFLARHPHLAKRGSFSKVAAGAPAAVDAVETAQQAEPGNVLAMQVLAASASNRYSLLFDGLHGEAAKALGLAAGDTIDPAVPLTELGLDSLMAVELRNALASRLGRTLPATLLFNYPTLGELTTHLLSELTESAVAAPGVDASAHAATSSLDSIDEDEIAALLERKLAAPKALGT